MTKWRWDNPEMDNETIEIRVPVSIEDESMDDEYNAIL